MPVLHERRTEQARLAAALTDAMRGNGSVAIVSGEAGIGKTSLVTAFLDTVPADVRVLLGRCDDLLAPRALGPLRDATARLAGPLRASLDGPVESVYEAAVAQLRDGQGTVLVVEDVHWADDATIDVLRHVGRRIATLPALMLLSARDEALVAGAAAQGLVGSLIGSAPIHQLPLAPLSLDAVAAMANGRDAQTLHRITGGNPFYVTEVLAAEPGTLPEGLADTVRARLQLLGPAAVTAVEQIAVIPTRVELPLAEALLGDRLDALAGAEERGIIEVSADGLAFRHELARRAVEAGISAVRRRGLNLAVVAALRRQPRAAPERLVHHAVEAGDAATIAAFAPRAARSAAVVGSHRQALAHYEVAARHVELLEPADQCRLLSDYAFELYIAHRFDDGVAVARAAVRACEDTGETALLQEAQARLARLLYIGGDPVAAQVISERIAAETAATLPEPGAVAALLEHGAMLLLTDQTARALPVLEGVLPIADAVGRPDLRALARNYLGMARADNNVPGGLEMVREGLAIALAGAAHEPASRTFFNLGQMLYSLGMWTEFAEVVRAGQAFAVDREMAHYTYLLEIHDRILQTRVGRWDEAEAGLRALVRALKKQTNTSPYALAAYGRLATRRGLADAGDALEQAWREALRQRLPLGMRHSGIALVERAWLTGRPDDAAAVAEMLLPRLQVPPWAYLRGELLRNLARAGLPAEPFEGCPPGFAAGIRGDWKTAAALAEEAGDPYEQALELGLSGDVDAMRAGLQTLESLGAQPAAELVRRELRARGVTRLPRRRTTRLPGLTDRQSDVLELLVEGLSNTGIATRLGLSVRTVDHHVSAILARLGVRNRREVAAAVTRSGRRGAPRAL